MNIDTIDDEKITVHNEVDSKKEVLDFISIKEQKKNIAIESTIEFDMDFNKLFVSTVIHMLGILLDNAIDASPIEKTINVCVICGETYFFIEVSNEYVNDIDFSKIFRKRFSTKAHRRECQIRCICKRQ